MDRKKKNRTILMAFGLVIVLSLATAYGLHATSSMSYCSTACHEMNIYAEELRYSPHAIDKDGNPISCAQCHIPLGFGPDYLAVKAYSGIKDLYVHIVDAPTSLNRAELQGMARRFVKDDNCLQCHADLYQNAKQQGAISEIGKLAHDAYLGKNGQAKSNCAGCHINIAHLPDFDKRLTINKEFAERMDKKEALRQ